MDISYIAQVVGVIGAVLSVLYLALQIRQNTKAAKSETLQALCTRMCDRVLMVASDKNLAELIGKDWDSDDLSTTDEIQINYWIVAVIADLRDIHHQYELKVIPYEILIERTKVLKHGMFKSKRGKKTWGYLKESYEKSFVLWFEKFMEY